MLALLDRLLAPGYLLTASQAICIHPAELIPASHRWSDAQIAGAYDGRNADAPMPRALEQALVPMVVPAGACIFFHGTLMHRGGANRSAAPRLAFSNQYCQPWARTQESFFLGTPPALVSQMSPRLQVLLGYEIMPPFMAMSPRRIRARFCAAATSMPLRPRPAEARRPRSPARSRRAGA